MQGIFMTLQPHITLRQGLHMPGKEDRWLSISEICEYLGGSNDTVYKWISKHSLPAHRMGRLWKFKKSQVDAWVESGGTFNKIYKNKDLSNMQD